jgi:3-hydroxyisobutyrate dehydrogenase
MRAGPRRHRAEGHCLGETHGTGSKVNDQQLLAGVHIAAAAEAMALGIKAGADQGALRCDHQQRRQLLDVQNRAPHILAGDYPPRSAVNIFVKDLGMFSRREKIDVPAALTAAAHQDVPDGGGGRPATRTSA